MPRPYDCQAEPRIVLCETCGSEGHLIVHSARDWHTGAWMDETEPCPYCEGTGGEIIETQPIDMEDLDVIAGEVS